MHIADVNLSNMISYGYAPAYICSFLSNFAWTDTLRYPDLRAEVEDECQMFMVSMEDNETFWKAEDFIHSFVMTEITIEESTQPLVHQ